MRRFAILAMEIQRETIINYLVDSSLRKACVSWHKNNSRGNESAWSRSGCNGTVCNISEWLSSEVCVEMSLENSQRFKSFIELEYLEHMIFWKTVRDYNELGWTSSLSFSMEVKKQARKEIGLGRFSPNIKRYHYAFFMVLQYFWESMVK